MSDPNPVNTLHVKANGKQNTNVTMDTVTITESSSNDEDDEEDVVPEEEAAAAEDDDWLVNSAWPF